MRIDRMLDAGPVEIVGERDGNPWRSGRSPGDALSDLPADIRTAIAAHWSADVGGGQTRAERWQDALPED